MKLLLINTQKELNLMPSKLLKPKLPLILNNFTVVIPKNKSCKVGFPTIAPNQLSFTIHPEQSEWLEIKVKFKQIEEYNWLQRQLLKFFF